MQDREFEGLCRELNPVMQRFVDEVHGKGIGLMAVNHPRPLKDGLLLTIRKSGIPTDTVEGSLKLVNDGDNAMVRVECADTRVEAGQSYAIDKTAASQLTPDELTRRMHVFVDEFLRRA